MDCFPCIGSLKILFSRAGHAPTQSITLEVATGENLLTFCDIKDMELVSPPFTCIDNTLDER